MPARAQLLAAPLPVSQMTMPPRGTPAAPGAPHHLCAEGSRVLDLTELEPSCRTLGSWSSLEVRRALCHEEHPSFHTVIAHARTLSLKYFLFHFT